MKQRARPAGPRSALATVLILIAAACGSSDSAAYLEGQYGSIDIASLSLIAYVGTNWDVPTLAAPGDAAQERLAAAELDPEEAAMVRMANPARIADATLADEFAPDSTTATLARVLRCDEAPLTDRDVVALDALVEVIDVELATADEVTDPAVEQSAVLQLAVWTLLAETGAGAGAPIVGAAP